MKNRNWLLDEVQNFLNDLIDFFPTCFLKIKKHLIKTSNINVSKNYFLAFVWNLHSVLSRENNKNTFLCLKIMKQTNYYLNVLKSIDFYICLYFVGYTLNGRSVLVSCWVLVPSSRELKRQ